MSAIDFIQLSRIVSHALRHEPQSYNLKLDNDGWVLTSDLVTSLNKKDLSVTLETIIQMVEHSEKKRHQILDGKIRAYYGHSTNEKISKHCQSPPDILYHGTVLSKMSAILENGLLPMDRQYVHLSIDEETAKVVASRRMGEIVIVKVKTLEAYENSIEFYKEKNGIWLSEPIPPKYLYL